MGLIFFTGFIAFVLLLIGLFLTYKEFSKFD
jgi:hypothetical protein